MSPRVNVILGGDVMLGRLVGGAIREYGPDYPLGEVARLTAAADIAIVNLECAITASTKIWQGEPKAFYFGAPATANLSLSQAGIDAVVLANNHVLDFEVAGLDDTLRLLDEVGIRHAGAGSDLASARAPAILSAHGIKFGLVAYCDHQADFAAGEKRPGIAYIDLDDQEAALKLLEEDMHRLKGDGVDWPVLSLHWGPNMVERPSPAFRQFAHKAIDAGFRILFGHSAHVFHGVELYRGCPIIYAAGDFVDDYYVDPEFRNDHQLLYLLELSRERLCGMSLYPIFIRDCRVQPARNDAREFIVRRARLLNAELGTTLDSGNDGALRVAVSGCP